MDKKEKLTLNKAEKLAHILEGVLVAMHHIDRVIGIIPFSKNVAEAKESLIKEFNLSDTQVQAIVDMRLRALTGLEREKLENEYWELMEKIAELKAIIKGSSAGIGT